MPCPCPKTLDTMEQTDYNRAMQVNCHPGAAGQSVRSYINPL